MKDEFSDSVYNDLFARWPKLLADLGEVKRVGVESAFVPQAMWQKLAEADPDVEDVTSGLEREEMIGDLSSAIRELPEREQVILSLYYKSIFQCFMPGIWLNCLNISF